MNTKIIKTSLVAVSMLFISISLSGCNSGSSLASDQKSGSSSSAQSSSSGSANIGIEKPKAFSPAPISGKNGLGVYGSGKVEAGKNVLQVEINTSDLSKVKPGYTVSMVNAQKNLMLSGKVKSIPDSKSVSGDVCNIEVALDATDTEDPKKQSTVKSQVDGNNGSNVTSFSGSVTSGVNSKVTVDSKVTEDSDVDVTINLPKKDGVFYVYSKCVHEGKDGKKYVWVSKKKIQEIKAEDWELKEVKTGDTDGKKIEIISGLDGDEMIAVEL